MARRPQRKPARKPSRKPAPRGVGRVGARPSMATLNPWAWMPPVFFSIVDYNEKKVTRTVNPDGTITEKVTLIDRKTGAVVAEIIHTMTADGTLLSGVEGWLNGPVVARVTFEDHEGGRLKKRKTWVYDANGQIVATIVEEYDNGRLRRLTNYAGEGTATVVNSFEYGYDGSGRLIRVTERDADGKVTKVTTTDYRMDGSYSVTTTDYSTSPATVTRTEYTASGVPR